MKLAYFGILALATLFSSCISFHEIKIKKDGSATVSNQVYFVSTEQQAKLNNSEYADFDPNESELVDTSLILKGDEYNSPYISNFKKLKDKRAYSSVQFQINHVDNLGPFLDPNLHLLQPTFSFTGDKLVITCPPYVQNIDTELDNEEDELVIPDATDAPEVTDATDDLNLSEMFFFNVSITLPKSIKAVSCNNPAINYSFKGKKFNMKSSVVKLDSIDDETRFEIIFN